MGIYLVAFSYLVAAERKKEFISILAFYQIDNSVDDLNEGIVVAGTKNAINFFISKRNNKRKEIIFDCYILIILQSYNRF